MIIVGKKVERSFADMFLAYLQRYLGKRRVVFSLHYLSSYNDVFSLKNHIYDGTKLMNLLRESLLKESKVSIFSGVFRHKSILDQIEGILRDYRFKISMVKVDKTYSCIGIDFNECLKEIDLDDAVRWAVVKLVSDEIAWVSEVWDKGGSERFFDFVSKKGMDNFLLKDAVIKEYGKYDVESLASFCKDLDKSHKGGVDLENTYYGIDNVFPRNTPVEKEIKNALLQGKIVPVFRTGRKSGKTHAFKGFIPYIMINNETQAVYTSGGLLYKKGKDLIGSMSKGELEISGESYYSDYLGDYVDTPLAPILSKNQILFKPTTYEGNTFTFKAN